MLPGCLLLIDAPNEFPESFPANDSIWTILIMESTWARDAKEGNINSKNSFLITGKLKMI
jgi:hypothetical protein